MKKVFNKKTIILLIALCSLLMLSGCQRNTDANGHTLLERVIFLNETTIDGQTYGPTTFREAMEKDSFFSALLVWPLSQAINWVANYTGVFFAIIIVTLVYNVLILPLSVKSTVSTQKLQMLQPDVARIQDKYVGKDDPDSRAKMGSELQQLYAKNHINPLGSLITPFLQFPILIAMYYAVQRSYAVCYGTFANIELITTPWDGFKTFSKSWPICLIFILMLVTQFLSSKVPGWLAQKSKEKKKGYKAYADNKGANKQGEFMQLTLILMVGLLGIKWPTAMSVYWLINSVINIGKTIYIQKRYVDHE